MSNDHHAKHGFLHFEKRCAERIGPGVDAKHIWDVMRHEIENGSGEIVQFVARMSRSGRRLWKITIRQGVYFVIYDHELDCPITVLDPHKEGNPFDWSEVRPQGKHTINLRDLL